MRSAHRPFAALLHWKAPVRAAALLVLLVLHRPAAAAGLVDYTVKRGDTCASIARHFYKDAKRVDLIDDTNDLGPQPHRLVPGTVLHLPPNVQSSPDAVLTAVTNGVDKFTPRQAPAHKADPLKRGDRVSTQKGATAEITFRDGSKLKLQENTLVVILGNTSGRPVKGAGADETTLVSGELSVHLGELIGRRTRGVSTAGGRLILAGDARVQVDETKKTRLCVYRGSSSIITKKKSVRVTEGFGSEIPSGGAPTAPRALPAAPVWAEPPSPFVLSRGPGSVHAKYAMGSGSLPARWHVQVATDEAFNAVRLDSSAEGKVTSIDASELPAGRWFVRVSAVDDDGFEGPFLPPATVQMADAELSPGGPGLFRVTLSSPGATILCGVDDEPLTPRDAPFDVEAHTARALRCAPSDAKTQPVQLSIPPLKLHISTGFTPTGPTSGIIRVAVRDGADQLLPGLQLVATPEAPLVVGAFHEDNGQYRAEASWPPHTTQIVAHLSDSKDLVGVKFAMKLADKVAEDGGH
jgi:hypothetical protein